MNLFACRQLQTENQNLATKLENGEEESQESSFPILVIVIIFAIAALLTPPDPITQIGLAIPLLILYELSILTVKIIEKKK